MDSTNPASTGGDQPLSSAPAHPAAPQQNDAAAAPVTTVVTSSCTAPYTLVRVDGCDDQVIAQKPYNQKFSSGSLAQDATVTIDVDSGSYVPYHVVTNSHGAEGGDFVTEDFPLDKLWLAELNGNGDVPMQPVHPFTSLPVPDDQPRHDVGGIAVTVEVSRSSDEEGVSVKQALRMKTPTSIDPGCKRGRSGEALDLDWTDKMQPHAERMVRCARAAGHLPASQHEAGSQLLLFILIKQSELRSKSKTFKMAGAEFSETVRFAVCKRAPWKCAAEERACTLPVAIKNNITMSATKKTSASAAQMRAKLVPCTPGLADAMEASNVPVVSVDVDGCIDIGECKLRAEVCCPSAGAGAELEADLCKATGELWCSSVPESQVPSRAQWERGMVSVYHTGSDGRRTSRLMWATHRVRVPGGASASGVSTTTVYVVMFDSVELRNKHWPPVGGCWSSVLAKAGTQGTAVACDVSSSAGGGSRPQCGYCRLRGACGCACKGAACGMPLAAQPLDGASHAPEGGTSAAPPPQPPAFSQDEDEVSHQVKRVARGQTPLTASAPDVVDGDDACEDLARCELDSLPADDASVGSFGWNGSQSNAGLFAFRNDEDDGDDGEFWSSSSHGARSPGLNFWN